MQFRCSKNNILTKVISAFIAVTFIFSSVDVNLVLAQAQNGLNSQKLATPSIWRPLANEGYAISEELQFELLLGTRLLYKKKGDNLKDVNSILNRMYEARKRTLRRED